MKIPFNDLFSQHEPLKAEIFSAIEEMVKNSSFIGGKEIASFEKAFSEFCGPETYCSALSNGTDALQLALIALGVGAGDEVLVPAQSFIATIEPIITLGAKPLFVDIDPDFYCIDVSKVEEKISSKTKAIVGVHLYGHPADFISLKEIAKKHNLKIIEDAAQAHGADIRGKKSGTLGDIASFSFYPGKNLGAWGDAGAVVSNTKGYIDHVHQLRNHGRDVGAKYDHAIIGYNCRMDTLQAAILAIKLQHLDNWIEKRRAIAARYTEELKSKVLTPKEQVGFKHTYHLYVVQVENRDSFKEKLSAKGIQTGIHYPRAMTEYLATKNLLQNSQEAFPVAEHSARSCISLPIYPEMTEEQVDYVVKTIRSL